MTILYFRFAFVLSFQKMSYDGIGVSDTMLDSLSLQLREAELRRAEAERAHQVTVVIFHSCFNNEYHRHTLHYFAIRSIVFHSYKTGTTFHVERAVEIIF